MDELIERSLRGEASPRELERLAAWRSESPEHERRYRELERLLGAARSLRVEAPRSAPPSAAAIIARAGASRARREPPAPRRWRAAAVRAAPWGLAAAAALVAVVLGARLATRDVAAEHAEVVTGTAELATVTLRDGSVIRLAPMSRLGLGGRPDAREVTLDGRAYFAVAHQRGQPFVVRTRAGAARVLGTRFELATRDDDLELVVVEGRVAIDAPENSVEVRGGETSRVARGAATPPARVANADSALRWIGKFLVFQATPLGDAARQVEATYGVRVVVEDSVLARHTLKAAFTDQSVTEVAAALCSMVDARCTWTGETLTMSRK